MALRPEDALAKYYKDLEEENVRLEMLVSTLQERMADFDVAGTWMAKRLADKNQKLEELQSDLSNMVDAHLLMVRAQELTIPPYFLSRAQQMEEHLRQIEEERKKFDEK